MPQKKTIPKITCIQLCVTCSDLLCAQRSAVCVYACCKQTETRRAWAWQKTRKHNKWQYLFEKSNQTVFMYIVINEILHIKSVMTCFFFCSRCAGNNILICVVIVRFVRLIALFFLHLDVCVCVCLSLWWTQRQKEEEKTSSTTFSASTMTFSTMKKKLRQLEIENRESERVCVCKRNDNDK